MPLKNYSTVVPADRSIAEIQSSLAIAGATAIALEYDPSQRGRVLALRFKMLIRGNEALFSLPADWRRFQQLLTNQGVIKTSGRGNKRTAAEAEAYAYRVAWRCLRDWVLAQMALVETEMVDLPQVFLPYAVAADGRTLYELCSSGEMKLLGAGGQR